MRISTLFFVICVSTLLISHQSKLTAKEAAKALNDLENGGREL
jgi:hypothetical protein